MKRSKPAVQNDNSSSWTTAEKALEHLRSGMRVFVGSGCAAPQKLAAALAARGAEVYDVEIIHILTFADAPYARRECAGPRFMVQMHDKKESLFANTGVAEQERLSDFGLI